MSAMRRKSSSRDHRVVASYKKQSDEISYNKGTGRVQQSKGSSSSCKSIVPFPSVSKTEIHYEPLPEGRKPVLYRDAVCSLCEKTVSLALAVPLSSVQARTRSTADVALARQIAMYLCNTTFSLIHTEVGLYFKRDRTTVAHACRLIEDKRDDIGFDVIICQLEALLLNAREAAQVSAYFERDGFNDEWGR